VTDEAGSTTLNLICYDTDAKTVQVLLDCGADPNIKNKNGETPVLAAVDGWNAKVVSLLVRHGADKNIAISGSASNSALQRHIDTLLRIADHASP
jgi:ankyrin repeat protein